MEGKPVAQKYLLLALCWSVLWCAGCFTQKSPAHHFTSAALARPIVPPPTTVDAMAEPPDIPLEYGSFPVRLGGAPRNPPPRPRVAPTPAPEPAKEEKLAEPLISPELSDEQLAAAKIETQRSLNAAEQNLALTQGRQLNAAQEDVTSKIRGFVDASREAMKNGDWPRARNSAKKAEVLSQELANSL